MIRRPSFADVEREILAELPPGAADPASARGFEAMFGASVREAADAAALLTGTVPAADLRAAVGRMARIVVDAIGTAAGETGTSGQAWVADAQRWALRAYFARLREVSRAAGTEGGRA